MAHKIACTNLPRSTHERLPPSDDIATAANVAAVTAAEKARAVSLENELKSQVATQAALRNKEQELKAALEIMEMHEETVGQQNNADLILTSDKSGRSSPPMKKSFSDEITKIKRRLAAIGSKKSALAKSMTATQLQVSSWICMQRRAIFVFVVLSFFNQSNRIKCRILRLLR